MAGYAHIRDPEALQDQGPAAKRHHRKLEERAGEARLRYLAAKSAPSKAGPPNYEFEEQEYRRCRAAMERAAERVQAIGQSLRDLNKLVEVPQSKARQCRNRLESQTAGAVAGLDRMIDGLADYLQGGEGRS
jgi:hypothetical protein